MVEVIRRNTVAFHGGELDLSDGTQPVFTHARDMSTCSGANRNVVVTHSVVMAWMASERLVSGSCSCFAERQRVDKNAPSTETVGITAML